jgi:hypothetical protein
VAPPPGVALPNVDTGGPNIAVSPANGIKIPD